MNFLKRKVMVYLFKLELERQNDLEEVAQGIRTHESYRQNMDRLYKVYSLTRYNVFFLCKLRFWLFG